MRHVDVQAAFRLAVGRVSLDPLNVGIALVALGLYMLMRTWEE